MSTIVNGATSKPCAYGVTAEHGVLFIKLHHRRFTREDDRYARSAFDVNAIGRHANRDFFKRVLNGVSALLQLLKVHPMQSEHG